MSFLQLCSRAGVHCVQEPWAARCHTWLLIKLTPRCSLFFSCVQDAREYFQHLLEVMTRAERTSMQRLGQPDQPPTADVFRFELEDRIQCMESSRLSYKRSLTNVLAMDIPVDAATNKDELEDFQVQS